MPKILRTFAACAVVAFALLGIASCSKNAGSSIVPAPAPLAQPQAAALAGSFVPGQIEVGFRAAVPADIENVDSHFRGLATVRNRNTSIRFMTINVQPGTEADAIARLRGNPRVSFAVQDRYVHATAPNDPLFAQQYALTITQWDIAYNANPTLGGSASTVIAIVDTGIQTDHPDLAAKIVPGATFVAGTRTPYDDNGHGTHVAGIAAAVTNNGVGIAGVNPGARLMPVKVLDSRGSGSFTDVANGITFAANNGANVISMSLGCPAPCSDPATSSAISYAKNTKNALVVVAAGNDAGAVAFPGSDPNSMAIAASDSSDGIATFSNFGPQVSVAAPGVNILSTYLPSTYATLSGTSMSTPFVSGLAGLLVKPGSTPATIRQQIESTADKVGAFPYVNGRNDNYGFGRVNVNRAVGGVAPPPPSTPTPPPPPPPPPDTGD